MTTLPSEVRTRFEGPNYAHVATVLPSGGRVVETWDGDRALEVMDRLAVKYTGEPFPMRSGRLFLVEPEQVQAMTLPFTPLA